MNGHTQVTVHHDGTAYVHTGNDGEHWEAGKVKEAAASSKKCDESRNVYWPAGSSNCPCLACEVSTAARSAGHEPTGAREAGESTAQE